MPPTRKNNKMGENGGFGFSGKPQNGIQVALFCFALFYHESSNTHFIGCHLS